MNNIHKVIFSKTTQKFVVVSELAKSAGKPKSVSADTLNMSLLLQNFSEKRPLVATDDIVETAPRFTNRNQWLSSDYMLKQLNYNHDNTLKRLGDGFYEQRLINEQINQLTGRRFIQGYNNDLEQYKALMNNGVKYAKQFNLSVGVGLTAKQMSELTTDMVWLVNKEITLADGRKVTALVPQVYLVARNSDITSRGAVISANQIIGNVDNLQNSGVIAGRDLTRLHSNQLENRGTILGDTVDLSAKQNLINLGGKIEAVKDLSLYAGKNLDISSTLSSSQSADGHFARTALDQFTSVKVTGEGGRLSLHSDGNLTVKGANVESQGSLNASASDSLHITTLHTHNKEHYGSGDNYYRLDQAQEIGSVLSAKENLTLIAQHDTTLRQADVSSEKGKVLIGAINGDVNIEAGRAEEQLSTSTKSSYQGRFGLSKTTEISRYAHSIDNTVVSRIAGSDISIIAQQGNVALVGTQATAKQEIQVSAGQSVLLDAAVNYAKSESFHERKKSGVTASLSKGVASIGYARHKANAEDDNRSASVLMTMLNATTGNINITAFEGDVTANAAQLGAGKDIQIQGQNVHFNALTETADNQFNQTAKSSGVGVSMVYDPASVVKENFKQQGDQNSAVGIVGTIMNGADASSKTVNQLMNPGSPYANHQRSQSNQNSRNEQAIVGSVNAGGNLTVIATEGDITAQGTQFSAEGDGTLWAKEDVLLGVATSRQNQHNRTARQAVSLDLAKGGTSAVGAYADKGLGKGETLTEQAAVLSFGSSSHITAEAGNVELVGTQIVSNEANRIEAGQDVILRTAQSRTKLDESQTAHSIGEVVISDTERFAGYNRKLDSQNGEQISHQQALVASLNESVNINAGTDFHTTSGQILAKNRINVSAEEVTFDTAHNTGNSQSHQSDLKLGQFSRVSSPLIDLIQTVEQAVNNKAASDRIQTAQALGAAAKAYTTAANLANGGALLRVESGTGYSHSRDKNQTASRESVGNQVNAQHIDITSRSGDINTTHTAFTSKDEQGNRLKDSSITFNSAKDLNLNAGQSEYQMQGKQQSSGFEVGTGVAIGAQTGWYFYAQAGFSSGKQDENHLTHQNSQIDTETLNINTQGNTTLKGAVAQANTINADIKGNLTVESLQDIHQSESDSAAFGGRVQVAIGTAWGGSAYGNMASGESNSKQVAEQSGLFAEEGGYNVTANNVELIGGAIASQNPENSTLTTNTITFTDIQNESSSQAVSAGISASANLNKQAGTEAKSDTEAKRQAEIAKLTGTAQSNGINPSIPMFDSSQDSSTTKATLTEGTIILNKDTHPTQTTAKGLGINTDLSQANRQVEQPKDINQTLREQQILSQAAGNVAEAVMTYAENQKIELQQAEQKAREAAEQAAKSGDVTRALAKLQEAERLKTEAERWETGGDNKRKATVIATALSLAVAGKPVESIAAGAASPYINEAIKHITENTDSKTLEALNIPLHILWGAVEAELAGGSVKAGAVAAGVGEIGARVLEESVYGKQPSELTEEEKQNLLTTSKALAGIAVASTNGGSGAETLANASVGIVVAENAVENNYLKADKAKERFEIEHRIKLGIATEEDLERKEELDKEYIANRQKVITACNDDITNNGCAEDVSEALTVLQGYDQVYPNENWKTYGQILSKDYQEFQELLYDKTGLALDFEQRAKLVAKGKNISIDEARTLLKYLDRYHSTISGLGSFLGSRNLPSVSSVGKSLDELSDFSKNVPKGANANEQLPVVGRSTGYENQTARLTGGEYRSNLYSKNWETASLSEAIDKFAGNNPNIIITEKGKRIYENPITKIQVVEDLNGKYFRIFDPSIKGRRAYLDLKGNIPSNKILDNGKVMGRSQGEYNQSTHFNIGE